MDLTSHYFDIFGLPKSYQVDKQLLRERYLTLQKKLHPDQYVSKLAHEQRLAVQSTATINQAYGVLVSPVKRAQYLLELSGIDLENVSTDSDFLMEQMRLRERLDTAPQTADPLAKLSEIERQLDSDFVALEAAYVAAYDGGNFEKASEVVVKMQYMVKLLDTLDDLHESVEIGLE